MRQGTRDTLLWLAGLGGAVILLRAAMDLLEGLGLFLPPVLLGALLVFVAAGAAGLLALRSRLKDDRDRAPISFLEHRP